MQINKAQTELSDTRCHIVWTTHCNKRILVGEVAQRTLEVLQGLAEQYGLWVYWIEVSEDHVHMLLDLPPKYSADQVVHVIKATSGREVLRAFPDLRNHLCGDDLWSDEYSIDGVDDQIAWETIKCALEDHPR